MRYVESAERGLAMAQLIGIIVAVVLLCCCCDSRNHANAPKEPTDPVTLVFTDIESSTALWVAWSELMPDTVATHHQLIRALIAKYSSYGVKTIGDSFMIACKSVFAAVQLVRELQRVFLQHAWGTSVLDDAYRKFEEGRAEEEETKGYVPPTARLDAAVYRQYWSGLRVRVGVHTGLCDIRPDEVGKGYDYYGDTANMAARTESVWNGGQVLLTRAAYIVLSTAEREEVEATALGAVAPRRVEWGAEFWFRFATVTALRWWQPLGANPLRPLRVVRLGHRGSCAWAPPVCVRLWCEGRGGGCVSLLNCRRGLCVLTPTAHVRHMSSVWLAGGASLRRGRVCVFPLLTGRLHRVPFTPHVICTE
ncbi:receptor-type adenylate cyclase [Trypanosoma rangeli]|uniref:adenylate cyclase n=1 Tax=Trypanosoma rangeli TaxID=5698 RepID=A0A422MSM9_TRYRA|nr:receptor-type adenylate cyclase [Trypanosoma rangeli]RNE96201.1 receptor-type adenylate cyclase [Trypanosoma rangeli]|eukprot:RNE96201.1 receptor-type adenylate cyclase [Trypanosoma rangeli]